MRESKLVKQCREHVEGLGGKMPCWVSPGNVGVQDRILLLSGLPPVFIEFKGTGGRYRSMQHYWYAWMLNNGFEAWKIDSFKDFVESIEKGFRS